MPIERPPLVGEVSANYCGLEGCHIVNVADLLRPYSQKNVFEFQARNNPKYVSRIATRNYNTQKKH
jgi:hypothetical protein